jgi:hypothetical protein
MIAFIAFLCLILMALLFCIEHVEKNYNNGVAMVSIKITPIKTKAILPNLQRIVDEEFTREAKRVKQEYESTTRTWKHKPDFEITGSETTASLDVGTDDKIYGYVDKGTKPHIIKPKRPGYPLRFNATGFKAKTVPNRLNPRAGRPAQPPTVAAMAVKHPGNEARNFSKIIQEHSLKRFAKNFQKRINTELNRK